MKEARTLITGGMGFIGLRLTRHLLTQGQAVTVLDNLSPQIHGSTPDLEVVSDSRIRFLQADINDPSAIQAALKDATKLVHLAAETGTAQSMYRVGHYNYVNSQGTALLMDALINQSHCLEKVVLASSRAIYGEGQYQCATHGALTPPPRTLEALQQAQWEPCCPVCGGTLQAQATLENAAPNPASIYAASKYAQEDLIRIGCMAAQLPFTVLRFQNVYGAGQSLQNPYTGILSIFSNRIRAHRNIPIFEDGLESRDFVHVNDVVHALAMALDPECGNGGVFNVGSGVPTSVLEVATLLFELLEGIEVSRPQVSGQFRLGDVRHGYADITRIRTLGWQPQVTLEQGLLEFCTWVSQQPLPEDRLDAALAELTARNLGGT